jgi:hypothetical protein
MSIWVYVFLHTHTHVYMTLDMCQRDVIYWLISHWSCLVPNKDLTFRQIKIKEKTNRIKNKDTQVPATSHVYICFMYDIEYVL